MVIRTDWLEILEDVFSKYTRNSFQGMQHKVNAPLKPHLKLNSAPLHRREFASNVDKRKKEKKNIPRGKEEQKNNIFQLQKNAEISKALQSVSTMQKGTEMKYKKLLILQCTQHSPLKSAIPAEQN